MEPETQQNPSTKHRPAFRSVSTKQLPRKHWFINRKQDVGSLEAALAVGVNVVIDDDGPLKSFVFPTTDNNSIRSGIPI